MPRFRYKAITARGEVLRGELEATTRSAAVEQIRSTGHLPVRAEEILRSDFASRLTTWRPGGADRPRRADTLHFTRELATLVRAGLPLDNALMMLESASEPGAMKGAIAALRRSIQGGAAFSDALAEHAHIFDRLYISMIRAGEAGGALEVVLDRLADYLERAAALRASVLTALIYPAILVFVAVLSLCLLMTLVVPRFIPLFEDAGATLPLLTRAVFGVSGIFRDYWWLMLASVAAAAVIADRRLRDEDMRRRFDAWCLRAPLIGRLLTGIETTRFARTLGTLLGNGVPLLTGVRLVRDVVGNRVIASELDAVTTSLERGGTLSGPLLESDRLPRLAVQLIQVGEESGQLDAMLTKVADIFDQEVQTGVKRLLTVAEPLLILGLGGVIAVIIMSILVAVLGLNELIH